MNIEVGLLLTICGGVMLGNSMAPLKYMRKWRWENVWIVFSVVALVLFPWALALWEVPKLLAVYAHANFTSFIMPFVFGAGWGVAQVLFGLAIIRVGMAVAFAITIGLSAALGTLVPIIINHPDLLLTGKGSVLLLGICVMLIGVIVCSWAARRREYENEAGMTDTVGRSYIGGLLMATVAGILAPMLNYALAFGNQLIIGALHYNTSAPEAPYAVWPIVLAGGAIPNLAYAMFLIWSKKSWVYFRPAWPDIILGVIMGLLWMGAIAMYGTATTLLGVFGASVGWGVFQICMILAANISGWIAGEWTGTSIQSKRLLWSGLLLLGSATLAIVYGTIRMGA